MKRLIGVAAVVIALALAAVIIRLVWPPWTPPFRGADGRTLPDSIAAVERWPINGQVERVVIRGRDRRNPVLIWLHGDAMSETAVLRQMDAALEDHFTVVYWDQRYAGHSLRFGAPRPANPRLADYVGDLDVLVGRLQSRLGDRKVVLVGHSFGSAIGILYAQRHPEKVAAYVGVSQVVDTLENERRSFAWARGEAVRRGDSRTLAELDRLGPPPRAIGMVFTPRPILNLYGGGFRPGLGLPQLAAIAIRSPEANGRDFAALLLASPYVEPLIRGEFTRLELSREVPALDVPTFFASGRFDHQSEAGLAHEYYTALAAPKAGFHWFERSGHNPHFDEPKAFTDWMAAEVAPIAAAAQNRPSVGNNP